MKYLHYRRGKLTTCIVWSIHKFNILISTFNIFSEILQVAAPPAYKGQIPVNFGHKEEKNGHQTQVRRRETVTKLRQ